MGARNWNGTTYGTAPFISTYRPICFCTSGVESTSAAAGLITLFHSLVRDSTSTPIPLPTGTYNIGSARFVVNSSPTDGPDVFIGLFDPGGDVVINNINQAINPNSLVFGSASVNLIPEPSTATLVGLGLVGITVLGRRGCRS